MGNTLSGIFGGRPKEPKLIKQTTPIERIQQDSNIADQATMKALAKRCRATILSQTGAASPTINRTTLGAGV